MLPTFAALALASVIAIPAPPSSNPPPAKGTILPTSVTLGEVDPNGAVPTLNGVPGAGTPNWDIAIPNAALNVGQDYVLTATLQDIGFTGACFGTVTMTQQQGGENVILRQVLLNVFNKCDPGLIYLVKIDFGTIPNAPGPVTLKFEMNFSGHKKTSIKVPMVIQ